LKNRNSEGHGGRQNGKGCLQIWRQTEEKKTPETGHLNLGRGTSENKGKKAVTAIIQTKKGGNEKIHILGWVLGGTQEQVGSGVKVVGRRAL